MSISRLGRKSRRHRPVMAYGEPNVREAYSIDLAMSREYWNVARGVIILLIAIGAVGVSSSTRAAALTATGEFLQYFNVSDSILFGSGSERIRYGANSVIPNGSGTGGFPRPRAPRLPPTLPRVMKSHELYPSFPHPLRPIFFKVHLQYLPTQREIITQTILPGLGRSPFKMRPPRPLVFQAPYFFRAAKSPLLIALPFRVRAPTPLLVGVRQ